MPKESKRHVWNARFFINDRMVWSAAPPHTAPGRWDYPLPGQRFRAILWEAEEAMWKKIIRFNSFFPWTCFFGCEFLWLYCTLCTFLNDPNPPIASYFECQVHLCHSFLHGLRVPGSTLARGKHAQTWCVKSFTPVKLFNIPNPVHCRRLSRWSPSGSTSLSKVKLCHVSFDEPNSQGSGDVEECLHQLSCCTSQL